MSGRSPQKAEIDATRGSRGHEPLAEAVEIALYLHIVEVGSLPPSDRAHRLLADAPLGLRRQLGGADISEIGQAVGEGARKQERAKQQGGELFFTVL